ncbi:SDR family oxidoreductase [Ekhidna sp.]|uniref:SDR family oxidoreductase n=1 Tax=Ekhidna sp. TaxID=2608089 RepID=UPI003B58D1D2
MKILLTGSTGYIGRRLLPELVEAGHTVVCPVRDARRFDFEDFNDDFLKHVEVIECDFLDKESLKKLPPNIDVAYYLIHSLTSNSTEFSQLEATTAENFNAYINATKASQVIYLGGIANDAELSVHLSSRRNVENILKESNVPITVLRSAIIIGSGGASFEIIRDLVEKLPVMIAPKWLNSRCQPIGIANVLEYLVGVLGNKKAFDQTFDIGGKDVLTYKQMLLQFAEVRGLKRYIITVPVLTIKLSSLWLYLVTSTSYRLARNLVDSMKNEVVVRNNEIDRIVKIDKLSYKESLKRTFTKISEKQVVSSWKDSFINPNFNNSFLRQVEAPKHGCFKDIRTYSFKRDPHEVIDNIWAIGGERGWYYGNFLWKIRGFIDKLVGGVGLRRGRRSPTDLKGGDALDFWRVLYANKKEMRLLLFAEMRLPGDAWLEFRIKKNDSEYSLIQSATFRPLGVWGRIYWYLVLPFHGPIFRNMARNLISFRETNSPSRGSNLKMKQND